MKRLIGADEIISDYGYFPTFHDDIIKDITILPDKIKITIKMITLPKNTETYPNLLFVFNHIQKFELSYEGQVNDNIDQIFEFYFEESENYIMLTISGISLSGFIICGNIQILKI